ncbi:MAG: DUF2490 domain-containing protein [Gammaproteobacteria bacterium]|nr:DUF2490 domain-containing protein [Gammaproteobacteria bacterium]
MSMSVSATEDNNAVRAIFTTTDTFQDADKSSRWHYWFDAQARYIDVGAGINQYLLRPGIGYKVNDNLTAWAGYARLWTRGRSGNVNTEDRFWQQLSWTAGRWNGGKITMRARLEQRSVSAGDDLGLVLRFNVKYARPIGDAGKTSLVLAVEPFVDLRDTDWGGESGLGQNRAYIGIGWRASERLNLETGYMNQFLWNDSGEDRRNHVAVTNFNVKF